MAKNKAQGKAFKIQQAHMEPIDLSGLDNGADEEEVIASFNGSASDTRFDTIVGHIEEIVMSDKFQNAQNTFLEKHYQQFEDTDENKLEYTDIHKDYTQLLEKVLEEELMKCVPGFNMDEFQEELVSRKDELDGEIFEMLLTFSDFVTFKEMVLDYRARRLFSKVYGKLIPLVVKGLKSKMKEGRTLDLSNGIHVTPLALSSSPPSGNGIVGMASGSGDQHSSSSSTQPPSSNSTDSSTNVRHLSGDLNLLIIGTSITPRPDQRQ